MLLHFEERRLEPGIVVLEIAGRLAMGRESQKIETLVEGLAKKGEHRVVFDLGRLEYIDSAGVGMLALCAGKCKEAGGQCVAVVPAGRVLKLLKLTQVDAIVPVYQSLEAAAASFTLTQPPAAA